jgi:hypothetical protein
MLRWQFAAAKDIDAPLFSKIERGECHAKHEQIIAIAKIFKVNGKELSEKALNVAQKQIKK